MNTPTDLIRFYHTERVNLSLLQNSILLNKANSILRQQKEISAADIQGANHKKFIEEMMNKVASHIFSHIKQLDSHSVLQTLKVCAYNDNLSFRPSREQLL